jgi:ABC-2 type transport system ATP-binding protein
MIKLSKVSKSYGKEKIVDNVSLDIKDGTIFGFLGPNGAGKTTTIKMMVGISEPSSGKIYCSSGARTMNHKLLAKGSKSNKIDKSIIGYMPEDPYFYDNLTAKEFLQFMGDLFPAQKNVIPVKTGIQKNGLDPRIKSEDDKIKKLLDLVGLPNSADKSIATFSKGMKQRLGLAQALVNNPEYVFLDEPLDGLDPIGRREFKKIILGLKKQKKTVFFNSHILADIEEICDQIGIIDKGKLIYTGPVKKFRGKLSLEDTFVAKLTKK